MADGTVLSPANRESEHPDPKHGWTSLFHRSTDDGKSWTETAKILSRPGNIQSTAQQLADGSLVAFCRPRCRDGKLWRSTSTDGGKTWPVRRDIETGAGPYGYTAVLRTSDGEIHMGYDCDRRVIKEVVVDEAWFGEPAQLLDYTRP